MLATVTVIASILFAMNAALVEYLQQTVPYHGSTNIAIGDPVASKEGCMEC